jgi:6-phosphogluconate dehydrogenase
LRGVFTEWNTGELQSYLVEITALIFTKIDDETGKPLVDVILDEAAQKGTGKWTSQNALDVGAPIPTINAAVESRIISALKSERVAAGRVLRGPAPTYSGPRQPMIDAARDALYASRVATYAQGLAMLRLASDEYHYGLRPGAIARIWRAGCIIRARLLGDITAAWERNPQLTNLLLDDAFRDAVMRRQDAWRRVVQAAVGLGIPVPATAASLAYFDAYRTDRLPANLIQAQRDYFGAHTYRRVDKSGVFHTQWPQGGQR